MNKNAITGTDHTTQGGAIDLAEKLEHGWIARGCLQVRFWAEATPTGSRKNVYAVRSNLINGNPPGMAA